MPCNEIIGDGGQVIGHWCQSGEVATMEPQILQVKWCFGCRKHLPHVLKVWSAMWYDPEHFWACGVCGKDRTTFGESA